MQILGENRFVKEGSCENYGNKLGLSCAKLRPAWASYQLAFVQLGFAEAAWTLKWDSDYEDMFHKMPDYCIILIMMIYFRWHKIIVKLSQPQQ